MKNMSYTAEMAMDVLGIPLEEREKYFDKL